MDDAAYGQFRDLEEHHWWFRGRRAIFFERACWLALQGRPLSVIPPEECEHLATTYGSP